MDKQFCQLPEIKKTRVGRVCCLRVWAFSEHQQPNQLRGDGVFGAAKEEKGGYFLPNHVADYITGRDSSQSFLGKEGKPTYSSNRLG